MATYLAVQLGQTLFYFCSPLTDFGLLPSNGIIYRWLTGAPDPIREVARAPGVVGLTAGETPSYTVKLANAGGLAEDVLGCPLRAPAQLVDTATGTLFDGLIAVVTPGIDYQLTIEA